MFDDSLNEPLCTISIFLETRNPKSRLRARALKEILDYRDAFDKRGCELSCTDVIFCSSREGCYVWLMLSHGG